MSGDSAILHTYSKYNENTVRCFNIPSKGKLIRTSLSGLRSKEQELYRWVGESTYQGFIEKLRSLFNESEEVHKALSNFQKANLIINLQLPANLQFVDQEITVDLQSEPSPDLSKFFERLKFSNRDFDITFHSSGEMIFSFQYNEKNIKNILNEYYQRERFDTSKVGSKRSSSSNPLRYANKAFKELVSSNQLGKVAINKKPANEQFKINTTGGPKENFRYTKDDIQKAIKNNTPEGQALRQKILNSRNEIYQILKGYMNGIEDLERAFERAWNAKMGRNSSTNIDALLNKFEFFAKGDNLSAGVSGAVQELFGDIVAEYVNIKIGRGIYGRVAKVMGNIAKGNEQPKTDLQILRSINIQVKAYDINKNLTFMSTNIHPGSFEAALNSVMGGTNIADIIVQAVFNSTNGSYKDLESQLQWALPQLMNLDTNTQLEDKVSFYLLDAQNIVPGSHIVLSILNSATSSKVSIRTSFDTGSDKYYNAEYGYDREERNRPDGPNFLDYFAGDDLDVTELNTKTYNLLLNKNISIDVKFDYAFMTSALYSML